MDAVFILGMHRSGTSCLAGCLEARGLFLGRVAREAGVAGNPRGTLEWFRINDLNEELLGSWLRPRLPIRTRGDVADRIAACVRTLEERAAEAGATRVGIKDPRLVLTLPFWRDHFDRVQLVGTFRNPGAVHKSLRARRLLGPRRRVSLTAWKTYNRALVDVCRQEHVPLISFDRRDEEYRKRVGEISRDLGLTKSIDPNDDFFQPDLRHPAPVSFLGDPEAEEIYRDLQTLLAKQSA